MEPWKIILLGVAGAVVPDVLRFINGRFEAAPAWVKSAHYWAAAIVLAALGGAVAYFLDPTRAVDALAAGYAAPSIVGSLLGRTDGGPPSIKTGGNVSGLVRGFAIPGPDAPAGIPVPQWVRGIRAAWGTR
jgi:hypothetical protein